ncbi:outer membrane protein assembly factor BamD [Candidatus Poribacteria bacterium]|nr:outer membrane protein assembly factor BamD [Candidatus Poribacteria bacterium]
MKKIALIIIPLIIIAGISTYGYFNYVGKDYSKEYFIEGRQNFDKGQFREAYYNFRKIVLDYKHSRYFEEANNLMEEAKKQADIDRIYEKAIMNYNHNNFRRAQNFFNYIIQNYPKSKYYKDALDKESISRSHKKIQNEFEDAELAQKSEDYALAINKYEKIINEYPESIYIEEARANLKACREELIKITSEQAKEWTKARDEKNRQIAQELYVKANEYFSSEDYYKALKNYQKIINNYPQTDHLVEAKERATRVMIIINDVESKRLFFEGKQLNEAGRVEKAIEKFGMVVKIYPNTEIYFRAKEELALGQSLFGKKMFDEAKEQMDKGNKNEGMNIFKSLIAKYPNTQWSEQAKFQIYLLQATGIARDLLNQVNDFYRQKEYAKSAEIFEKIIRNYPDDKQLLESAKVGMVKSSAAQSFILAESLFGKNETQKDGIEKYNGIIRDFPTTEWAEKCIAKVKEYNETEAEKIYKTAEDIFKSQNYEQAISAYQLVITKFPSATFANKSKDNMEKCKYKIFENKYNKIQELYINKEHFEEAIVYAKALIKESPDIEWKLKIEKQIAASEEGIIKKIFNTGRQFYDQDKYKEAISTYEEIIKKYSKNLKYVDEAKQYISMVNSELNYKKIVENLETQQYAIVTKSFNQLRQEKFAGDWVSKAQAAIEPHLQNILNKAFDFLAKGYYDYALDMFRIITENYPESVFISKAKEGVFKVNLNKPTVQTPQAAVPIPEQK